MEEGGDGGRVKMSPALHLRENWFENPQVQTWNQEEQELWDGKEIIILASNDPLEHSQQNHPTGYIKGGAVQELKSVFITYDRVSCSLFSQKFFVHHNQQKFVMLYESENIQASIDNFC